MYNPEVKQKSGPQSERCGNDAVRHSADEISMSEVRVREMCGRDERDTLSGLTWSMRLVDATEPRRGRCD